MQSDIQIFFQFRDRLRIDLKMSCGITELKKAYDVVQDLDASKLAYTFRNQDHRIPAFKSTLHQYSHRVNSQNIQGGH